MIERKKNNYVTQLSLLVAMKSPDAKAGGAPAAAASTAAGVPRFKMRPDEALRILNIEKTDLTKKILDEVNSCSQPLVPETRSCKNKLPMRILILTQLPHSEFSQRFKTMFAVNDPAKGGSFYIQSKIYRSKEVLEKEVLGIEDEPPSDGGKTHVNGQSSEGAKKE
jgi:hypothetical protein